MTSCVAANYITKTAILTSIKLQRIVELSNYKTECLGLHFKIFTSSINVMSMQFERESYVLACWAYLALIYVKKMTKIFRYSGFSLAHKNVHFDPSWSPMAPKIIQKGDNDDQKNS